MENKFNKEHVDAQMRAKIITSAAQEQYKTEIERLQAFVDRWNAYLNSVVKEYPSDKTRQIAAVGQTLKDILERDTTPNYTNKEKIADMYKVIGETKVENKKTLYGVGENGFNMDDVLSPKEELDLKSLLSELGVTK